MTNSLDKSRIKILLLEGLHPSVEAQFRKDGYENITSYPKAISGEQLTSELQDTHFLGIRSRTQMTEEVLTAAPKLAAIGCFCIGTNQVDLEAAQRCGIPVFNAPFANTRSVAELVLGEIILLLRGVPARNAAAHRGEWQKSATSSFETRGKTLGIVGYGHIGTQLGVLAEGLGMRVCYFDVENKLNLGNAENCQSLDELLASADVVSLHVPATKQTTNLIGSAEINKMRPGAFLINASRGTVVDIDALAEGLKGGHLAGAAVDVFPIEPKSNQETFVSPLTEFDNVILTPHIGGSTQEAQKNIGMDVSEKLLKYSNNGSTIAAVNFPEVGLPEHRGAHRLLHIHRNQPGVLSQVNKVFSDNAVNIAAQYLQTSSEIGYVVTDVAIESSDKALQQLREIDGTIRARVLY